MKESIKKLFSPILNYFESGEAGYSYRPSHRKILIVVGVLFLGLSSVSAYMAIQLSALGGALPILIFFAAGVVCEVVGLLGSDQAVARMWKSK